MPNARAVSFIDDITVILPLQLSLDMAAIGRESYGMAAGTPEGRRHLVEPKEIADPASRWSWARTTDGRAAMELGSRWSARECGSWEYQLEPISSSAISYRRRLMESKLSS